MKKRWTKIAALALALCAGLTATGCLDLGGSKSCKECVDEDADHRCDVCYKRVTDCTDEDDDHRCETCGTAVSVCIDADHNHYCDICNTRTSGCTDATGDHHCDVCSLEISYCLDVDDNHRCDVCNRRVGCEDVDHDGHCDDCTEEMAVSTYTVNYYVDGEVVRTETVYSGEKAPTAPREADGFYQFVGWATNENYTNMYDFTRPVYSNVNLYAYYQLDYAAFTNELTVNYMDGIVSVHTIFKDTDGLTYSSLGSGVLYKYVASTNTYYLLTNNHVVHKYRVAKLAGRRNELTVRDCFDTEYAATLVCTDAEYDLAVVKFTKDEHDLTPFEFATSNPTIGQEIVAIGAPYGQKNAITYGKVVQYGGCNIDEMSSIDFQCVQHDAWMATGSSGGLMMDLDFKIIGVNFAINVHPTTGEHTYSWAVPLLKVKEYLTVNNQL